MSGTTTALALNPSTAIPAVGFGTYLIPNDDAEAYRRRSKQCQNRLAGKYGVSEEQLRLRWGVQNGYAVPAKSLNPDRMLQNIDLFSFAIDDADMAQMATMDRGDGVAWAYGDPSK